MLYTKENWGPVPAGWTRSHLLGLEDLTAEEITILLDLADRFEKLEPFTAAAGEAMVKELSQGQGMGPWVHPIRVAVTGRGEGIGLFETCELLGKEKTVARLRKAAASL